MTLHRNLFLQQGIQRRTLRRGSPQPQPGQRPCLRSRPRSKWIPSEAAPPASQTGGFDGAAAYDFRAKLVAFGPRPPDTDAIRKTQDYILSQLKSFGCATSVDDFHASTPIGELAMKNIVAKVQGSGKGIILLLTHYDTVRIPDFVGANDAASSSGLLMEVAQVLCARKTTERLSPN